MWCAYQNVESGVVHAVWVPGKRTPHGFAVDWPIVETDKPLTCHLCLQFAFAWGWRDPALAAMLPQGELAKPARPARR